MDIEKNLIDSKKFLPEIRADLKNELFNRINCLDSKTMNKITWSTGFVFMSLIIIIGFMITVAFSPKLQGTIITLFNRNQEPDDPIDEPIQEVRYEIPFEAIFKDPLYNLFATQGKSRELIYIKTYEELTDLVNVNREGLEKYNQDYFQENALLVYLGTSGTGTITISFSSLEYINSELKLNAHHQYYRVSNNAIRNFCYFIEFERIDDQVDKLTPAIKASFPKSAFYSLGDNNQIPTTNYEEMRTIMATVEVSYIQIWFDGLTYDEIVYGQMREKGLEKVEELQLDHLNPSGIYVGLGGTICITVPRTLNEEELRLIFNIFETGKAKFVHINLFVD